jgi:Spy/CpxP family protein refolding chaperone
MSISRRAIVAGLAVLLSLSPVPMRAQEPSPPKAPRVGGAVRRVPRYFGKVGLTTEQRETIYKVIAEHQTKIEALEAQIAEAKAKMMKECEDVLTETQKQLLEQHRAAMRPQGRPAPTPAKSAG